MAARGPAQDIARYRADALDIYESAVAACATDRAVEGFLGSAAGSLLTDRCRTARQVWISGAGKAAAPMARALVAGLPGRIAGGAVVVPHDSPATIPVPLTLLRAGHPVADEGSLHAGRTLLALARATHPDDLWIFVLTGGASALLEYPVAGLSLESLRTTQQVLLRSAAPIDEINAVRARLSRIKSGGLARACVAVERHTLVVSDVLGNDLSVVGSGPMCEATPRRAAADVAARLDVAERLPQEVRAILLQDPAKSGPASRNHHHVVVLDNRTAVRAARQRAEALGFEVHVLSAALRGLAAPTGRALVRAVASAGRGACVLASGEVTVAVGEGEGVGGRAQEVALAAAAELPVKFRGCVLAAGTDGRDGPTAAAGAVVDSGTCSRARAHGYDPAESLKSHDSYSFLDAAGDLIPCRWTDTNVLDLVVAIGDGA